jgi:nitroreductase
VQHASQQGAAVAVPPSPTSAVQLAALGAARLAPSAHNSQPWRFQPAGDELLLRWDAARELPHGDPRRRYLMTGLGAAAESLLLGAGRAGEVEADLRPEERLAARVRLGHDPAAPHDQALAAAIPLRQTTRLPFADEPPPTGALARLAAEAGRHGCQLLVVTGRRVGQVAALVGEGTAANFADPAVYQEFHAWLRIGARAQRDAVDGLPLAGLAGSLAELLAPWLLDPASMRRLARVGLHRAAAATQERLARRCPAFCLLVAPSHEPAALFAGGRALLRAWLAATALGLRVHPMTAAMDHDHTRAALAAAFGAPASASMVACFRLGSGPLGRRAPKRPLGALLDHDPDPRRR